MSNNIQNVANSNDDTIISIKNLTKEYKMYNRKLDRLLETMFPRINKHSTFKAMDDLNLDVKKGEVVGILGKNGAGKSTLLKMITGVVTPTSGSINVNGKISSLLELGTAFNPELTGYENIYQNGLVMGLTKEQIKQKEQEIIDFADIGEHLSQPVKTYSSGMFARLAFACAINVDPEVLIVDEVLSVGDMAFQLKCFKKFEEFKKRGKTILFVTHSIVDVIKNCNRAIIISGGRKIYDGNVKQGVDKYKKIIVGLDQKQIEDQKNDEKDSNAYEINEIKRVEQKGEVWKDNFTLNPDTIIYGNGKAEIIDYGIFDLNNNYINSINNNEEIIIKMKVRFNELVDEPIFAMSIKDFKGLEVCGVNTYAYKKITGTYQKGDVVIIEFRQIVPLAPDKYTVSFGCTRLDNNGNLEAFQRKYDAIFIEVLANRDCLGLFDLKTQIELKKGE